jgi:hypothetical protein
MAQELYYEQFEMKKNRQIFFSRLLLYTVMKRDGVKRGKVKYIHTYFKNISTERKA